MKLKALFEYDDICNKLINHAGYHGFEDEADKLKEDLSVAIFTPEDYKEVNIYNIPVEASDFNESCDNTAEVAALMNDFAEKYNIESVCITRNIPELSML